MRVAATLVLTPFLLCLSAVHAVEPTPPDVPTLSALADKAQHAGLKDQCYLYARLVQGSTALAEQQLAAGDHDASRRMFTSVETYAAALESSLARDSRKLKDTEIMLRESAFRLHSAMLSSSLDDRPGMARTLDSINQDETKIMAALFAQ